MYMITSLPKSNILAVVRFGCLAIALVGAVAVAQERSVETENDLPATNAISGADQLSTAAAKVDVRPGVQDDEILARLRSVFKATGRGFEIRMFASRMALSFWTGRLNPEHSRTGQRI